MNGYFQRYGGGYRDPPERCMCGASDCRACRGDAAELGDTVEPQLDLPGYTYDGEGEHTKTIETVVRVARRDHRDGKVKRGDTYRTTTIRVVEDDSRRSYHRHYKRVVKRG